MHGECMREGGELRGGSVPACPWRTRGRGVRPAGLSPRNGGSAGRGRRPPACGPANAGKCGRATASAAGRPARCGVVRIRARMSIEERLGLTARGAEMVRRWCDGGEPGRPVAHGSGYGCGVRASERVVRSVEAKKAERLWRGSARGASRRTGCGSRVWDPAGGACVWWGQSYAGAVVGASSTAKALVGDG